jgi:hypothetical protein
MAACLFATFATTAFAADRGLSGRDIYRKHCTRCHGGNGQGVPKVNETPLHGTKSLAELTKVIHDTMPEKKPELCVGEDAKRVAQYIYNAFYSPQARVKGGPARIELARLTVPQYLNSVADLLSDAAQRPGRSERPGRLNIGKERGLNAEYFKTRRFRGNERVQQRIDPRVAFDFGTEKPHKDVPKAEEFSIRWQGSVIADETGEYEFSIKTELGARLWVNNYNKPLIDQWVASQGRPQTHTATIRLLGGRAYHLRLDVLKYKDPSASISLEWKPPHKAREVIPRRHLSPQSMPETFVVSTPFPPDDRVSGYDRGVSISKEWDAAATQAAIETANAVVSRIENAGRDRGRRRRGGRRFRRGGSTIAPAERKKRAQEFCRQLAERAFRRPLTDAQRTFFVDAHFVGSVPLESAVKRSVLLVLKSPRFLYPGLGPFDDYAVASRLALGLWDSVPDRELFDAAEKGQLKTPEQIAKQAERMLADPRAKAKLRHVFHDWLMVNEKEGITKDKKLFPDFDERLASDLRTSLDLFIDSVVWSEKSDYRQLLLADHLFVNDRLAKFYGIENSPTLPVAARKPEAATAPDGDDFRRVTFEPGKRAGVLTHPYLLSMFAYHNLSSPIHRGVFLTRRVLGRTLKPPPQATEFKDGNFAPHMTTREKVALLTKPAACMTCHSVINPLGFSLEHFDAVGRYREKEKDRPIDASSVFETSAGKPVKLTGARSVAEFVVTSRQARGAFVDHLFHQTVKQPINAYGPKTRDELIGRFEANGFHIRKLLVEIVKASITYERSAFSRQQSAKNR